MRRRTPISAKVTLCRYTKPCDFKRKIKNRPVCVFEDRCNQKFETFFQGLTEEGKNGKNNLLRNHGIKMYGGVQC